MRFRILASLLTLSLAGMASATPINFTFTGTGSGDVAGSAFSNAAFTISATGDTVARQDFGSGFFIDHMTTTITIAGVGSFTISTPTRTFVNNGSDAVGFSRAGTNGNDLYNGPSGVASWDMLSDLSVAGTFGLLQWALTPLINTNGGVLTFASSTGPGTFTARLVTAAVPEPTTLVLMLGGLFAFALVRRSANRA